ncbi:MAG TPA: serine/threonine-protein kinase [Polyangiales bacterium]|nr:serine/threonine-protein kinase [Polyangiales bacterium]
MSRVGACPSENTLAALAGGELTDSALPRVVLHAAECSACSLQLSAAEPSLLNERYQLLRKLGEGGMGVVWEADDLVLGERVALKLLRTELARDARALEYLKSEVKLARQIGHAHVCRVFDMGSQSSAGKTVHFLSMEPLRGPSLRSLLAAGALSPQLALRLADQVLCGLQAAHAAGVLHRDLKPDNVLLRYPSPHEPHAVITDFGLARAFRAGQRHVTASRTLVGSAAYLAPEQVEESLLTEASDVYSFGVVLFELLTSQQPFQGETPLGVALKRLQIQPPRPSTVHPALGASYDAFVLRCLARDPKQRFQSAAEARAGLQCLLEAHPVQARGLRPLTGSLRALCTACAVSMWIGAEHNPRELQPTAASAASSKADKSALAHPLQRIGQARAGVPQETANSMSGVQLTASRVQSGTMADPTDATPLKAPRSPVAAREMRRGAGRAEAYAQREAAKQPNDQPPTAGRPNARSVAALSANFHPAPGAPQQASLDVLTPEGFLDPFAE